MDDFQKFIDNNDENSQARVAKFTDRQVKLIEQISKETGMSFGETVMILVENAITVTDAIGQSMFGNRKN